MSIPTKSRAWLPYTLPCSNARASACSTSDRPRLPTCSWCAGSPGLLVEELEAHCRKLLAPYKVPRHITFIEALPKSAVGKILRKELRPQSAAIG